MGRDAIDEWHFPCFILLLIVLPRHCYHGCLISFETLTPLLSWPTGQSLLGEVLPNRIGYYCLTLRSISVPVQPALPEHERILELRKEVLDLECELEDLPAEIPLLSSDFESDSDP